MEIEQRLDRIEEKLDQVLTFVNIFTKGLGEFANSPMAKMMPGGANLRQLSEQMIGK